MASDPDILREILAAEEEGRRRVASARQQAAARIEEARREIEEYRQALVDGIEGRLSSLDTSLSEDLTREAAAIDRRTDELIAAVERERDAFTREALRHLRRELLGGR